MAFISNVNGQQHTLAILSHDAIALDGVALPIDWRQIAPLAVNSGGPGGRYSLLINGLSYELFARLLPSVEGMTGQTYEVHLAGQRFEVQVEDERNKLLAGLARNSSQVDIARIVAPMPGLVLSVLVAVGSTVEAGQPVIVLEAMKMENDLVASIAGSVKAVHVSQGQTVDQGQALVIISAIPS